METENSFIPNKEIKVEPENSSRKNEVKVTNLLSEIRTTDLAKKSQIQTDTTQEKNVISKSKEEGDKKLVEGEEKNETEGIGDKKADDTDKNPEESKVDISDKKADEFKKVENNVEKVDDSKKVDNGNKKADDSKKVNNGEKKADDSKKVDNGDKKADDSKKVDNGDKKADDSKKVDNADKKADDSKKVDNGDKKADDSKKVDNGDDSKKVEKYGKKSGDSKKVENAGKKSGDDKKANIGNKNSEIFPKREKVSPLAEFFKDWDKFTIYQRIDIERFIIKKAEELGASSKVKSGVRTYDEKDRNRFRAMAIRRRRESRRLKASLRLGESLRDRRSPRRLRGYGDSRSRDRRENRRWNRYSPRRDIALRNPWVSTGLPVENLLKQVQRFVQLVDKFPNPSNMIHEGPKRPSLLPTPPDGYNIALRENGLHDAVTENKQRDYTRNTYAPLERWSSQQYPVTGEVFSRRFSGKEPSSKSLPKSRPSPYNSQSSYSSTLRNDNWSSRDRGYSQNNTVIQPVTPYQDSRFTYVTSYRR